MFTVFKLSRNTCLECLREPVFYLMLVTALVLIGIFPYFSMFVFRQQIKLVTDSAMATTLLFGLFASVLCSSHCISREMKNGTVLLLMSKPVTRLQFILSKMLGILSALTLFVFACNSATWLSILIAKDQFNLSIPLIVLYFGVIVLSALYGGLMNYFHQKSFVANAVVATSVLYLPISIVSQIVRTNSLSEIFKADPESYLPLGILLPALLLLFFAVWSMGVISSTLATRLELVGNLVVCFLVFLSGLVLYYFMSKIFGDGSVFSLLCTAVVPNWQLFWMADATTNHAQIPLLYIVWNFLYTLLLMVVWGFWAYYLFADNELARDTR